MDLELLLKEYDPAKLTVATLGSHSALDVSAGAKQHGFPTLVVTATGRQQTYQSHYRTDGELGVVDQTILLDDFKDILSDQVQAQLRQANAVFVPNRSFEVYLDDYQAIEQRWQVPMFGNRTLLAIEERGRHPNQYDLLDEATLRSPRQFKHPADIDCLSLVKVLEAERGFERAFFLVENADDYREQAERKIAEGTFTEAQLMAGVIEEFVIGVQVNFNYFYSPVSGRLELLGTDMRRQTNLEGFSRIPGTAQADVLEKVEVKYEEAGHVAVTVLESMLEQVFEIGEQFVAACKKLYPPGVIGPFALQSIITPGPPKKDIVVIDVSPRMPGSPGIAATPYGSYLHRRPVSVGERVAMELKAAIGSDSLAKVLT